MINFLYKLFRFLLFPLIYSANFLQNNVTSYFTPMNMGPVAKGSYSDFIKSRIKKKNYILDFGSGAGFFSKLFDNKKYLGVDINENFINVSRKKNPKYKYRILKKDYLIGYEKKINLVFINNVLHHLTNDEIFKTFKYLKNKLRKKTEFLIIEPLFPKTFLSLEFFMKVLDIGNNIKTKKGYLDLLKKILIIDNYLVKKVGIGSVLIIKGYIK